MQQVRAKDGVTDEVKQKELLGNKLKKKYTHTHNLFLNVQGLRAKRWLSLSFIRSKTLLSSDWGSEWHPGHSQLSPDNATFSRWKLWLKKRINVSELPVFSWVGERRDETTMPAWGSRQPWFRFYRTWKQGFGQNSETLIILPSSKLPNIW